MLLAELAQLVALPVAALDAKLLQIAPHPQQADEVTIDILPQFLGLVGFSRFVGGALSRIARLECRNNGQKLGQAFLFLRFNEHSGESRIERQSRHASTKVCEILALRQSPNLTQRAIAFRNGLGRWGGEEGKVFNVCQSERLHAQDNPCQ